MLVFGYVVVQTIGEIDCGRACGDYSAPLEALFFVGVAATIISTVVLAIDLATTAWRPSQPIDPESLDALDAPA